MAAKKTTAPKMESEEEVTEELEVSEEVDNEEGQRYDGGLIPKRIPSEQSEN